MSLALLRWLLGFRSETLVAGALDREGCTRREAAAIDRYRSRLAE